MYVCILLPLVILFSLVFCLFMFRYLLLLLLKRFFIALDIGAWYMLPLPAVDPAVKVPTMSVALPYPARFAMYHPPVLASSYCGSCTVGDHSTGCNIELVAKTDPASVNNLAGTNTAPSADRIHKGIVQHLLSPVFKIIPFLDRILCLFISKTCRLHTEGYLDPD